MQTNSGRGNSAYKSTYQPRRKRNNDGYSPLKIVLAIVVVCAIAALAVILFKYLKGKDGGDNKVKDTPIKTEVSVDGVKITGMGRTEAFKALSDKYNWSVKAVLPGAADNTFEVANLIDTSINKKLDEVFSADKPKEEYTIDFEADQAVLQTQIDAMKEKWNVSAKNGSILGFDKESGDFTYSSEEPGLEINEAQLRNDLNNLVKAGKFDVTVQVVSSPVAPEITVEQAKAMYKEIGYYKTTSTANSARNNNLDLACNAIDGTVIEAGDKFSFNDVVGQRTEENGYKEAAAYSNGDVVQEIGGGVCQVASTLYNAVISAGIDEKEAIKRTGHTYAPTYVTPGEDATVSFGGPDFTFINTTSAAVVIRMNYKDRTVTCTIIGIPILPEGETVSLHSEKTSEDEAEPAPVYEDDPTLEAGVQVQTQKGDLGSTWRTYITHKDANGNVISDTVLHDTRYRGHTPKFRRNQELWKEEYSLMESVKQTNEAGETVFIPSEIDKLDGGFTPNEITPGYEPKSTVASPTPASTTAAFSPDSFGPTPMDDIPVSPKPAAPISSNGPGSQF